MEFAERVLPPGEDVVPIDGLFDSDRGGRLDGAVLDRVQAVCTLMRFADEPAERLSTRQITRAARDDPRGSFEVEKGDFDREVEGLRERLDNLPND